MKLFDIIKQRIILLLAVIVFLTVMGCSKKSSDTPILILASQNDFGTYTGEILKTEGFNEFKIDSLNSSEFSRSYLKKFDLIILTESKIEKQVKEVLFDYVKDGGNLIAFRPDPAISDLFGIIHSGGIVSEGYIVIDTTCEEGKCISGRAIRIHGTADKYNLVKAEIVAKLFPGKVSDEGYPAVIANNYGEGHTIAFLYNLPKSIVLSRQGNPLFAGMEKDGIPGIRGMDMFTDGWVDTTNSTINQTDEQMVLLSHCIERLNTHSKPLPRLWYFPDSLKCLVTLTNDGEYKSEADFEPQFRDVDSMGAKMSIYIIGVDKVSKSWVDRWTARGFEIAGHPDDTKEAVNPEWTNMDSVIIARKNEIAGIYNLPMRTNVNHWFVWCGKNADGTQDFGAEAKLEEKNGIELDINYAHYDMKSNQGEHFLGPTGTNQGNFTGSGLIMKFTDVKGHIIDVFQHLNAVYDQEYNESHDPDGFYNCFKGLVDRSLQDEVYSFISIKSHNDEYYFSKAPLMRMLAYANDKNIPVWTALKLLDFIKVRDEASFSNIKWSHNILTFKLSSAIDNTSGLTFLLPAYHRNSIIRSIDVDGKGRKFDLKKIKGHEYALVTIVPGKAYQISADYRSRKK